MLRALGLIAWMASVTMARAQTVPLGSDFNPDVAAEIVRAFETHDVVLLSEEHYGIQFHGMLRQLISDPRIAGVVDDIAVEFGNALYQPLIDQYANGGIVAEDELRNVWRNTTQLIVWDSPLYEDFFRWVRTVNNGLAVTKRFRVLLIDPPIDWAVVHAKEDYEPFASRSPQHLEVIEREVLERGRKALVIIGGMHVLKASASGAGTTPSLGIALHQRHPGRAFSVWTIPADVPLVTELGAAVVPSMMSLEGAELAGRSFGVTAPQGIMVQREVEGEEEWVALRVDEWPLMAEMADGLLYLGTIRTTAPTSAETYADEAYFSESLRRATIMKAVFGIDFPAELRELAGR